jgi:hypothetical protein
MLVIALIVRAAARLSATNRAEGRLIAAEWAEQVAARRRAASRVGHALMLLISVGIPAWARRCVRGTRWGVVAALLVVFGAGLTIGSFELRDQSERVLREYGPEDQAADPEYRAWEATYGEALQSDDPAARREAWAQLLTVGPWQASEDLRRLADITFLVAVAMLVSALIAASLAILRWRWRRQPGVRLGNA